MKKPVKPTIYRSPWDYYTFELSTISLFKEVLENALNIPPDAEFYRDEDECCFRWPTEECLKREKEVEAEYAEELLKYNAWVESTAGIESEKKRKEETLKKRQAEMATLRARIKELEDKMTE